MASTGLTLEVKGRFGVVRPRLVRFLGAAGYAALTVPLLVAFAYVVLGLPLGEHSHWNLVSAFSMFLLGPAVLITAWRQGRVDQGPGTLTVDNDMVTLRLDGTAHAYAFGDFVDGAVRPGRHKGITLRLRNGEVVEGREVLTTSPDGAACAADLLAALGLDASARAVTLRTSAATTPALRAAAMYGLLFLALLATSFALPALRPLLLLPPGAIALWILAWVQHGPAVTVGVDGLRVRQLRSRFVPWSSVARVEVADVPSEACAVVLASGARVWLGRADGDYRPGADALAARIAEARALDATGEPPRAATTRGTRSVGEWRRAMAALLGGLGYRDDAVGADELVNAMRAGAASGEQRVGAALALVANDRERHATRVRIAAQALADEPVREAMENIAAGEVDDATLMRATRKR